MLVRDIQFDRHKTFDVVIGVCGYEPRSSYLCRVGVSASQKLAVVYPTTASDQFNANRLVYQSKDWALIREDTIVASLSAALEGMENPAILVDISSMTRRTMARIVQSLWESASVTDVHFIYAPARYESSAAAANHVPALNAGPVSDYFAGELRTPSIPVGLILGLGLEAHRASGLIELLEPTRLWAFAALSDDERFITDVHTMHERVLNESSDSAILYYDIRSMADVYNSLESLVFSASLGYRLLIAPSGPKLFTLAALLVGAPREASRPAIWRVGSSVPNVPPSMVVEAGDLVAAVADLSSDNQHGSDGQR